MNNYFFLFSSLKETDLTIVFYMLYKELSKLNSKKEKSNSKCAKDINGHFIEEDIQMANGHMKRSLTSLGKCKLKLQ